ncbi:hypothetical protein FC07_GL002639 [Loigolactobacillus bifermentans DSM 20003]|uniref:Uncharacterized protein n=2 Tax=Loigolactobacillus bifermentans TaxID=1607 RepID=A0A0R1H2Y0_9LACO|nr:hypothetical protein FC07_GL002639 [Loigolactobacillus bifermentans DSM 20003]
MDQETYDANKKQVRQDIADFNNVMYDLQDQMDSEAAASTTDTTEPTDDGTNGVTPESTQA